MPAGVASVAGSRRIHAARVERPAGNVWARNVRSPSPLGFVARVQQCQARAPSSESNRCKKCRVSSAGSTKSTGRYAKLCAWLFSRSSSVVRLDVDETAVKAAPAAAVAALAAAVPAAGTDVDASTDYGGSNDEASAQGDHQLTDESVTDSGGSNDEASAQGGNRRTDEFTHLRSASRSKSRTRSSERILGPEFCGGGTRRARRGRSGSQSHSCSPSSMTTLRSTTSPPSAALAQSSDDESASFAWASRIFERPVKRQELAGLRDGCPEVFWLQECARRCPLPPGWREVPFGVSSQQPFFVFEATGAFSEDPRHLSTFVQLARLVIHARSAPSEALRAAGWVRAIAMECTIRGAKVSKTWTGPYADASTGKEYYHCSQTGVSTWEHPAMEAVFAGKVAEGLLQSSAFTAATSDLVPPSLPPVGCAAGLGYDEAALPGQVPGSHSGEVPGCQHMDALSLASPGPSKKERAPGITAPTCSEVPIPFPLHSHSLGKHLPSPEATLTSLEQGLGSIDVVAGEADSGPTSTELPELSSLHLTSMLADGFAATLDSGGALGPRNGSALPAPKATLPQAGIGAGDSGVAGQRTVVQMPQGQSPSGAARPGLRAVTPDTVVATRHVSGSSSAPVDDEQARAQALSLLPASPVPTKTSAPATTVCIARTKHAPASLSQSLLGPSPAHHRAPTGAPGPTLLHATATQSTSPTRAPAIDITMARTTFQWEQSVRVPFALGQPKECDDAHFEATAASGPGTRSRASILRLPCFGSPDVLLISSPHAQSPSVPASPHPPTFESPCAPATLPPPLPLPGASRAPCAPPSALPRSLCPSVRLSPQPDAVDTPCSPACELPRCSLRGSLSPSLSPPPLRAAPEPPCKLPMLWHRAPSDSPARVPATPGSPRGRPRLPMNRSPRPASQDVARSETVLAAAAASHEAVQSAGPPAVRRSSRPSCPPQSQIRPLASRGVQPGPEPFPSKGRATVELQQHRDAGRRQPDEGRDPPPAWPLALDSTAGISSIEFGSSEHASGGSAGLGLMRSLGSSFQEPGRSTSPAGLQKVLKDALVKAAVPAEGCGGAPPAHGAEEAEGMAASAQDFFRVRRLQRAGRPRTPAGGGSGMPSSPLARQPPHQGPARPEFAPAARTPAGTWAELPEPASRGRSPAARARQGASHEFAPGAADGRSRPVAARGGGSSGNSSSRLPPVDSRFGSPLSQSPQPLLQSGEGRPCPPQVPASRGQCLP